MNIRQAAAVADTASILIQPIPPQIQVAIRLDRIFDELAGLRQVIEQLSVDGEAPEAGSQDDLWVGIAAIHEAIVRTRHEIASLHAKSVRNDQLFRATDELDAVVVNTESATETILSAAESIETETSALAKGLSDEQRQSVERVHDQIIRIFEACNFQDLTGQRIRKVVDLLQFVETRIASMISIWRSVGGFTEAEIETREPSDADLLNGPPLAGDAGIVSQDDIDSLFK